MNKFFLVFFVALSQVASVYAGKTDITASDNRVTQAGVISVYSTWVKDKGKKYDFDFNMKNEYSGGILVMLAEMHCYRGKEEGVLKHTFFNTGSKTIKFREGELKNYKLVCSLSTKDPGEYRVVIGSVYENKSGDGKTVGKELAKNVEWKVRLAE